MIMNALKVSANSRTCLLVQMHDAAYELLRLHKLKSSRVCEETGLPMVPCWFKPAQIIKMLESLLMHLSIFATATGLRSSDECMLVRRTAGLLRQRSKVRLAAVGLLGHRTQAHALH